MKIIKETPNLMIIRDRNVIAFVIGIILLFVGIVGILKPDFFSNQPPFWVGLLWILLGGSVIAVAKTTTINLDKSTNKLIFLRKGLIGRSIKEYDLKRIKEVELSVTYPTSGKDSGFSYHLAFVLNNGEIIQINPSHVIRVMGRRIIPEKNLGARIAAFLGVPFQERRPPTISEALSAIQKTMREEIEKHRKE